uniref:Transposase (putative) gypsy type domain-containing protein n=1 Tax=Asparagus officinalis TaxID=4686 RepID=Q2AA02_ASPOF|nr:hypothetical protein 20.t00035 [Asparagus officinalis]
MASQVSNSGRSEERLAVLLLISSKVHMDNLLGLYDQYNISQTLTLVAPEISEPVYCHGEDQVPLYLAHLEHGLRLPLHPFIKEVHTALGVSPFQFYPNTVGILVAFIIICHRVGVQPSLRLLGHLIGVGSAEKDPHYSFHYHGLEEQFVWVYGGDNVFACSGWPEANEDALRLVTLSDSEIMVLDKDEPRSSVGRKSQEECRDRGVEFHF